MSKFKIVPIFIPHAGCVYDCVFCNQKIITGKKKLNLHDIDNELNLWVKRFSANGYVNLEVAFYGGSFTALDNVMQEKILKLPKKYNSVESIRISTRPDCIDKENIKKITALGVKTIELGVQFMDDIMLKKSGRGHTVLDVEKAIAVLKNNDLKINVGVQLLLGFLGETRQTLEKTADLVIRLKPDMVRLYPLLVLNGTVLAKWYEEGLYKPLKLEEAVKRTTYLYERFTSENIKVIRTGLQDTETLRNGVDCIAGPYHPSFGELVQSYICLKTIENLLEEILKEAFLERFFDKILEINCNTRLVSKIIGNKKKNLLYLKEKYQFAKVFCKAFDVEKYENLEVKIEKISKKKRILL